MPVCPVCATENPDAARFCLACGAALSAEPRREERKVVTVLFADLVGFTSRSEQLDPEDVRAVLAPYWERLRVELEKRGGTVEKFIGDAVMALFGAPVAHDDDPLRAVGAALAIRDWAREEADVQVRIAVNTGEALVLLGARPSEGEGMAAGDVVNTTARLQAAAPVNGVLVGETTYRATRDVIDYAEHAPVVAKGKTEPIAVWEAVQVRSRLGMDVERASLPLVGRTRELGVIVDAFERAKSEREPQLVTLVGVPGIGKSRLVGEFFSRLEDDPELVWWRQGRALPYGEGVSFWAVADMVKAHAGIDENDPADVAQAKLRKSVASVVEETDRDWVCEHLLPLVGGEHRAGSGESAPAWRTYFEAIAEQRPLVLVFEDMHWADDGLLDFIDHVVDWASGVPILVLATARPELLDRRRSWGGGKLNVATIALTPLSDEESSQVIHNVLEQSALPAKTQQALLEQAGGNPLYAEQFARLYMERGSADDLPLPETVQGLIAARIDGLAPEEKQLLQDAAVFGKVFWAGALGADADALHRLERMGLLRRERRSAVAGETQYAFRHVLVRDVAYGQIPRAHRADKHLRAADWIESLGRADDHAELVAHHVSSALDLGAEVLERARAALQRAGERAQAVGAHPAAARYFEAALGLWPIDGTAQRAHLVAAYASAVWRATSDRTVFPSALDALESAGLREDAADLAVQAANAAWYVSSADVDPLLERAERLLSAEAPSAARAALLAERGRVNVFRANYAEGEKDLGEALRLAELLELAELRAGLLTTTGAVRLLDGDLDEARRLFSEVAATAPHGSPSATRALANLATTEANAANAEGWRTAHAAAVERASRAGDAPNLRWLEAQAIAYAVDFGQWDEALRRADAYLAGGDDPSVMLIRARILAARGAVAEARAARDTALAAIATGHHPQTQIPVRNLAAWVAFTLGDDEIACRLVGEAAPFVLETLHRAPGVTALGTSAVVRAGHAAEWKVFNERCVRTPRTVAALAMLNGDDEASGDLWARVSPDDEAAARLLAAERFTHAGRNAEAESQLTRALAYYRAVGAAKIVRDAEALLVA